MSTLLRLLGLWVLTSQLCTAQSYTHYPMGDSSDLQAAAQGGICLMGGATEDDNAMRWFLNRANGGDVVVLRTSGSDGYNAYFYQQLGVAIHSVETFVCHSRTASFDAYLLRRVAEAEAVWFAGGDQWTHVQYWRDTPLDSVLRQGIQRRNLVVGGTSAGMAIQGGAYFTAQRGTITSATALQNPYDSTATLDTAAFLGHDLLQHTITDTHYDNPDRRGRQAVFLARLVQDYGFPAKGIACDEYTAVCIAPNGIAQVFGGAPTYDDNAYFVQTNCLSPTTPATICQPNTPLTWNTPREALQVYRVQGTPNGSATFDLNDWKTGTGGTWEYWTIDNGVLSDSVGSRPSCMVLGQAFAKTEAVASLTVYPNPCAKHQLVQLESTTPLVQVQLVNSWGQIVHMGQPNHSRFYQLPVQHLPKGYYWVRTYDKQQWAQHPLIIQ